MSEASKTPGWIKFAFAFQTVLICIGSLIFFRQSFQTGTRPSIASEGPTILAPVSDVAATSRFSTFEVETTVPVPKNPGPGMPGVTAVPSKDAYYVEPDASANHLPAEEKLAPAGQEATGQEGTVTAGGPEESKGGNSVSFIPIRVGSPTEMAKTVKDVFGNSVKVTGNESSRTLIVVASQPTHKAVVELVNELQEQTAVVLREREIATLNEKARAEEVAKKEGLASLMKTYGPDHPIIRATQDQNQAGSKLEGEHRDNGVPSPPRLESSGPRRDGFPSDELDRKFDREAKALAKRIREAGANDQLQKELEAVTVRQFEHRQRLRKQEFDSMSLRLDSLKATLLRRQTRQAEIVKRRINDLLDPNADLRWDETASNSTEEGITGDAVDSKRSPGDVTRLPSASPGRIQQVTGDKPNPTYNGIPLSQWLSLLETERNPEKLAQAVLALNHLIDDADPRQVARRVFQTLRVVGTDYRNEYSSVIVDGSVVLLQLLPSQIVVDELINEISTREHTRPQTRNFLAKFLMSTATGEVSDILKHGAMNSTTLLMKVDRARQKEAIDRLGQEITKQSRRIIQELAACATRDESLTDWSVRFADVIVHISHQPITTFPELIPVVERNFDNPGPVENRESDFNSGPVAAVLLAESGLRIIDIVKRATDQLNNESPNGLWEFQCGARSLVSVVPHSPSAVSLLNQKLTENMNHLERLALEFLPATSAEGQKKLNESQFYMTVEKCVTLIRQLGTIGAQARESIPLLTGLRNQLGNRSIAGLPDYLQKSLTDLITDAVNEIDPEKPTAAGKTSSEQGVSSEHIADVDANAVTGNSTTIEAASNPNLKTQQSSEPTYDGITYSQWLKLLETERKPAKLLVAFDTITKLANPADAGRIAQGIFQAVGYFDPESEEIKQRAWTTGQTGLARLPVQPVLQELLIALKHPIPGQPGREFQARFLIDFETYQKENLSRSNAALAEDAEEIIGALMRLIPAEPGPDSIHLLAAASTVCRITGRRIIDIDGLAPRVIRVLPNRIPVVEGDLFAHWLIVAKAFVEEAPETADLAIVLTQHVEKGDAEATAILPLIGKLGRRAEPAVPVLVKLFQFEFKKLETTRPAVDTLGFDRRGPNQKPTIPELEQTIRLQIIRTLGEIGVGKQGYELLSQLKTIPPIRPIGESLGSNNPRRPQSHPVDQIVIEATKALTHYTVPEALDTDVRLISDLWRINGRWQLKRVVTAESDESLNHTIVLRLQGPALLLGNANSESPGLAKVFPVGVPPYRRVVLDDTQTPKLITLALNSPVNGGTAPLSSGDAAKPAIEPIHGIYEFSDTKLTMQLAQPGYLRPERFSASKGQISEGHVLLEFDRFAEPVPEKQ